MSYISVYTVRWRARPTHSLVHGVLVQVWRAQGQRIESMQVAKHCNNCVKGQVHFSLVQLDSPSRWSRYFAKAKSTSYLSFCDLNVPKHYASHESVIWVLVFGWVSFAYCVILKGVASCSSYGHIQYAEWVMQENFLGSISFLQPRETYEKHQGIDLIQCAIGTSKKKKLFGEV